MTDQLIVSDGFSWHAHARIDKYTLDQIEACQRALGLDREPMGAELLAFCAADDVVEADGNLMTRLGRKRLIDRFVETASNVGIKATTGRIGVGDSNTAAADTQTDLQAATNKQWVVLDSAPVVGTGASSGVVTLVATFTTGLANFAWQEWGIDGGTANGTTVTADTNTTPGMINRKVTSLGTKTSAASWVFTVTLTVT